MPEQCEHGGDWRITTKKKLTIRPCALIPVRNRNMFVIKEQCEVCSGFDDGTSPASISINRMLEKILISAYPEEGKTKAEMKAALKKYKERKGADAAADLLVVARERGMSLDIAESLALEVVPELMEEVKVGLKETP